MIIQNAAKRSTKNNNFKGSSWRINKSYRSDSFMIANNVFSSFSYAAQGISYTFRSQRNFRIHIFTAIFVGILGVQMKLPFTHLAILTLTISAVLILELLNTSLEALVDLTVGRTFNPLARIAKDCAAASVLVASISSFIVAILLIFPPVVNYFLT